MRRTIGITTAEHIATGLVEERKLVGPLRIFPQEASQADELLSMPADNIAHCIREQIEIAARGEAIAAVGIGFPGIIRNGIIEDSPNLQQLKGARMQEAVTSALRGIGIEAPVYIYNDADIVAAGLAATRGHLDQTVRVWTLGNGIGFGLYPPAPGVWEGGHMVVSLNPNEKYCGCSGIGHLEGIMGNRAMRLRFLDLEPEEVFEHARAGDHRCLDFVKLWHRALAAATSNSIHFAGPGKFFISGMNAGHVQLNLLEQYVHDMVKMSPLRGYVFEIVTGGDEVAVIGAAVNAEMAAFPG
jgi:predicted NBD/HSP70 family sugar kinase